MNRSARFQSLFTASLLLVGLSGCKIDWVPGVGSGGAGGGGGDNSGSGCFPDSSSAVVTVGAGTSVGSGTTTGSSSASGGGPSCPPEGCSLPGYAGSKTCQKCHTAIYQDWESSMHAHSLTSPLMIAQANQVFAADLIRQENAESEQFCTSCHGPISAFFSESGYLPATSTKSNVPSEALEEGIGCVTCHAYKGTPHDSAAVLPAFQNDFTVGPHYQGPFNNPLANGVHDSVLSNRYSTDTNEELLCLNCHNTKKDRNGDNKFDLGADLFLQQTFDEYINDYRIAGGGEGTCVSCHMPAKAGTHKAADGFPGAPNRVVHEHKFVGADYPLDLFAQGMDPQHQDRRKLIAGISEPVAAVSIQNVDYDGANFNFDVEVTNVNGGHNLPTGFTFMRQMWLEVVVKDDSNNELGSSGKLQAPGDDLCDNDTLSDILGPIVQGCQNNVADPQLVNFQTQLADFVALENGLLVKDPVKGHESWLEFQTGGVVARSRPADVDAGLGQYTLAPLRPFETRTYHYSFHFPRQAAPITLSAKLQFRNLPPYFARRIASGSPGPLGSLLSFDVITMATLFLGGLSGP